MKKIATVIIILVIAAGILSALYMQLNICKGEPYYYAPHEYNEELNQIINSKDIFYTPLWAMIMATSVALCYLIFKHFLSDQSYYSTILFLIMLALYIVASIYMFQAYNVIGQAQVLTGKTAEFMYGFFDLMAPFIIIVGICGINEILKKYNRHRKPVESIDYKRFKILKSILQNKE